MTLLLSSTEVAPVGKPLGQMEKGVSVVQGSRTQGELLQMVMKFLFHQFSISQLFWGSGVICCGNGGFFHNVLEGAVRLVNGVAVHSATPMQNCISLKRCKHMYSLITWILNCRSLTIMLCLLSYCLLVPLNYLFISSF